MSISATDAPLHPLARIGRRIGLRPGATPTQRFCGIVVASSVVLTLFQLVIGCSPPVAALSFAIILFALAPVAVYGASNIVGLLFVFVLFYFSFLALILKSIFLQPLQTYLYAPFVSHLVAAVGVAGSAAGALAARPFLRLDRALIPPMVRDARAVGKLAIMSLAVGLVGVVLNRGSGQVHALSQFLYPQLYFSLVAAMASSLIASGGRRALSTLSVSIALLLVVLSAAGNSKQGFVAVGLCYLASVLSFGGRIRVPTFIAACLVGFFLSSFVFPAITNIARQDRDRLSPVEMLERTTQAAAGLMTGDQQTQDTIDRQTAEYNRIPLGRYRVEYSRHLPLFFERFMMVPYTDAVVWKIPLNGPYFGTELIYQNLANNLPIFLYAGKQQVYSGHEILLSLGLIDPGSAGYQTMTLHAEAFYSGGLWAVFLFAAGIYLLLSFLLGRTIGPVSFSVFAVYIVVIYFHFFMSQLSNGFVFFAFRQFPVDVVIYLVLGFWSGALKPSRARLAANPTEGGGTRRWSPRAFAGSNARQWRWTSSTQRNRG